MQFSIVPAFIYILGAALIPVFKGNLRKIYLIALSLASAANIALMKEQTSAIMHFGGFKITLLHADKLSLFVAYIFILIGVINVIYVLHVDDWKHHVLAFLYVGGSLGVVFAGDYLSLYGFWELMALSSSGLVFLKKEHDSLQAGYRYLFMHLVGGGLLLAGILLHYQATGSFEVAPLGKDLASYFILAGVGLNSAFIFLHTWLPDAYPMAPYTGSIFLSVYTTKTAVYMLARLVPGWEFVAYMGAAMTIFGVTMALLQSNARKLLSYHIVSQVGYMVAAIGLGGEFGVDGGIYHLFNHILYKALLFMTIGAVIYRIGDEDLSHLGGVMRKMPITTVCAIVAALSISGIPLFNGFISKTLIFDAAHSNGTIYLMLEFAAVGTILSFLKFTYYGFLRPNKEIEAKAKEVPFNMSFAMSVTALLCFLIGVFPQVLTKILPIPIEAHYYGMGEVLGISMLTIATTIVFIVANVFFEPHTRVTYDFDYFYLLGARGGQQIAQGFYLANNALEATFSKLPPAIMSLRAPFARINAFFSRFLFSVFVDMWLFRPVTPKVIEDKDVDEAKTKTPLGYVVDAIVTQVSRIGERISEFTGMFDRVVVDGIVNGLGYITVKAGEFLKPLQTGDLQNYGAVVIGSSLILIIIFIFFITSGGTI